MSVWDIVLPHRLLINRSLRKESENLCSHINDYEVRYEQEIARCTAEIEKVKADKEKEYEKIALSLREELSKDAAFFEKVREGLQKYVDLYMSKQCLCQMRKVKAIEKQVFAEHRDFLTAQIRELNDEINILKERVDKLATQAKVADINEIIELSGGEVTIDSEDNAISLLAKISDLVTACDASNRLKKQALQKLQSIMRERADLFPVIQYIIWTIQQKEQMKWKLSENRHKMYDCIKDKGSELQEIRENINILDQSLNNQARVIRECWAFPITQLNIQISFMRKKLTGIFTEIKEIGEQIEHMKRIGSNDSSTWDRLWREKNALKEEIPEVKGEIELLESERKQWIGRQRMLYALCKKNHVYFIYDGKAEASDEYLIIDNRLKELEQIEKEAIQCEEERFQRESVLIQQERNNKIDELSMQIMKANKKQTEMDIKQNKASKHLEDCRKRDTRSILLRMLTDTEEIAEAREALRKAVLQKEKADETVKTLKTEFDKITKDFDRRLNACRPKIYCLKPDEIEEREKLENRKNELLNMYRERKNEV